MKTKKLVSFLLTAVMLFSFAVTAFATGEVSRVSNVINGDSDTSRGFSWYTDDKCGSDLQIAPIGEDLSSAQIITGYSYSAMGKYVHKVKADSLLPGTEYAYRVGDSSSNTWSEICYFETADKEDDSAEFIVIADVQASNDENFKKAAVIMDKAVEYSPNHNFIITLGDFVNDCTNEEWDSYFKNFAFANNNTTLVPVAGNHEGNLQWFKFYNTFNIGAVPGSDVMTGCYYSFDWGDAHFAVLNSNDMYPMSMQQINWLKNDMNKSDAQWKIILMHRALYSAGKNINKPDTLVMRNVLLPVIDELGIDVVFAGHDHMYFRTHQVKNDEVIEAETVTEVFNGVETQFMLNPEGTVHILPSTAGTKRYSVNEDAISPILDCGALVRDTHEGGVFAKVILDSEHFVYNAYMVDDETQQVTLIDSYAIKKTEREAIDDNYEELPTDIITHFATNIYNLVTELIKVLFTYITMLPSLIF